VVNVDDNNNSSVNDANRDEGKNNSNGNSYNNN
jgi:hypothetical protein